MGDTQTRFIDEDVVLLIVNGSLKEEIYRHHPWHSLIELIARTHDERMDYTHYDGRSYTLPSRLIFVLDLSNASIDVSDLAIIEGACQYAAAFGGLLVAVDPNGLTAMSNSINRYNSVEDAIEASREGPVPVPVQIFLDDESAADEVQLALEAILGTLGISQLNGPPPIHGSWYRQLTGWMQRASRSPGAAELARALDIQLVDRYQAGIDVTTSDAVATLITALEKTPGAVIQAGSVILVKANGNIFVRQLTTWEMIYWQHNPGLFKNPEQALNMLQQAADSRESGLPFLDPNG